MTTASEEKAGKEEVPPAPESRTLRRQVRTCASSVTLPSLASSEAVTQRVQRGRVIFARIAAWLDRPESLAHARPPSFAAVRERHHDRARRWNASAVRYPRLAYGYFHMIFVKAPLNYVEWATSTPLLLTGHIVLAIALLIWS